MERATPSTKTLVVSVMDGDGVAQSVTFTATLSALAVGRILYGSARDLTLPAIPVLIWVDRAAMITLKDLVEKASRSDGVGIPPAMDEVS